MALKLTTIEPHANIYRFLFARLRIQVIQVENSKDFKKYKTTTVDLSKGADQICFVFIFSNHFKANNIDQPPLIRSQLSFYFKIICFRIFYLDHLYLKPSICNACIDDYLRSTRFFVFKNNFIRTTSLDFWPKKNKC